MAKAVMATFSCSISLMIFLCGTEILAKEIYNNVWAVKILGSRQETKELAHKYGFSYDRHVSFTEHVVLLVFKRIH